MKTKLGLDENPFGGDPREPNADILNALFHKDSLGDSCIFRIDGKTEITVQSNTCRGIIDVRRIDKEKCDPELDPLCRI